MDDVAEFEVEEIVDSRVRNKKIEYRVHWAGYPKKKDYTWEPEVNVQNAREKVEEFHKTNPSAPRPLKSRLLDFHPISPEVDDEGLIYNQTRRRSDDIQWRSGRPP